MANEDHVKLLKSGVETWNEWREQLPNVVPDFFQANLAEEDLPGASLFEANLQGARLDNAVLDAADLKGANLQEANLQRANLNEAN